MLTAITEKPFILGLLLLFACLGQIHQTCAQSADEASKPDAPTIQRTESRFATWIADAPAGPRRLIELGEVTFQIDDKALAREKKIGLTRFHVRGDYRFRYATTPPKFDPQTSEFSTKVSVKVSWTDVEMTHEIVLASDFQPKDPWKSPLLQHEFDHVSCSTDPRLRIVIKESFGAPFRFEHRWTPDENSPPKNSSTSKSTLAKSAVEQIEQKIRDTLTERIKEIERIIQLHYDRLDEKTRSGQIAISDRLDFFEPFYSAKTLEEMEFADFNQSAIAKKLDAAVNGDKPRGTKDDEALSIRKATPWKEHYQWNSLP